MTPLLDLVLLRCPGESEVYTGLVVIRSTPCTRVMVSAVHSQLHKPGERGVFRVGHAFDAFTFLQRQKSSVLGMLLIRFYLLSLKFVCLFRYCHPFS
jgi:hypothetical protein